MTCRDATDFLADYLAGALAADVRAQFDRHLGLCPNCRSYLATYRATIEVGRAAFAAQDADAQAELPEELMTAILAAVAGR
jgi:anti-sigma factor RsiW